jgi:hypothetical protein
MVKFYYTLARSFLLDQCRVHAPIKPRLQTETVRLRWLREQNVLCRPKEWLAGNHDLEGVPRATDNR